MTRPPCAASGACSILPDTSAARRHRALRSPPAPSVATAAIRSPTAFAAEAMSRRVRIAPSPTGRLHIGNAYIALANWLYARQEGGWFLMRLDDTDRERSTAEFTEGIERDLRWLGLIWDEKAHQSARFARYAEAAERLKASARFSPCLKPPEDLTLKRKLQLQRGEPPVYDRAALKLSE